MGILVGAKGGAYRPGPPPEFGCQPSRLARAAIALGLIGVVGFGVGLLTVGGFEEAYGRAYSGGWSESGYVREFFHLTIPAVLMLSLSGEVKRTAAARIWLALFLLPLGIHGALGARRGPLFMVIVVCVAAWFLVRNTRPTGWKVLGGGAALGLLLLFVFANRNQIFIGSSFDLEASPIEYIQGGREGNEFIYGSGTIITADVADRFSWGGRYAQVFFIRPVPRSLWPRKYQVGENLFGVNIEQNMGVDIDLMSDIVGWRGAVGAAPGIVADMFLEFSWGMVVALFLIGLLYGRAWRACVTRGGRASVTYGMLLCLSLYMVMQTLEAVSFRFLLMEVFMMFAWRYASAGARQRGTVGVPVGALEGTEAGLRTP